MHAAGGWPGWPFQPAHWPGQGETLSFAWRVPLTLAGLAHILGRPRPWPCAFTHSLSIYLLAITLAFVS